jgi:beta-1,4-mannosyl-glycoprotein beta-1,4-N-acetylglucosaminyltransferase
MTYDCFMFFNELDLLEIRLNILAPFVDYFVIGESTQTFSGKTKPLYFRENENRFSKWANQIIRVEIEPKDFPNAFERAAYQKDSLRDALRSMNINNQSLVYFGDLDEIWKPQKIIENKVYNLKQLNYCYYLNNRSSEEWIGTVVGNWQIIRENSFNHWRAKHENILPYGGWHFTNMGGIKQIEKKLEAYDHQEFNTDRVKAFLPTAMEFGDDYVGREVDWQGKHFHMWIDGFDLPIFLRDNKDKYKNLFK